MLRIITHKGGAHADDFLAVAFLLGRLGPMVSVERRDPTEEELNDSSCFVVDVGGRHEPELNNYDHHQFDRDHEPTCAFSLVLQAFGLYDDFVAAFPWLKAIEKMDSKGPFVCAADLGVDANNLMPYLLSPMADYMLTRFQRNNELKKLEIDLLYDFGQHLFTQLNELRKRWDEIESVTAGGIEEIDGIKVFIADVKGFTGIDSYMSRKGIEANAVFVNDDRDDGFALRRENDDPRIDFSKVDGQKGVRFAHANGFVCKVDSETDCFEILRNSLA